MGKATNKGYTWDIQKEISSDIGTLYTDHYSILKELIQNADDAGAHEVNIVFLHPSPGFLHPLLTGPLLLFVNDEKFTAENARSIHQRRSSDKSADGSKIGMFGLGLKSVFHLCQAFFYVASPESGVAADCSEEREYPRSDILNPWGGDRFSHWNDVTESDLAAMGQIAESFVFSESKDWFALFVPLRLRRHCVEKATDNPNRFAFSTSEDAYFDESVNAPPPLLFSSEVLYDLPRLLPLLSTLNSISFWTANASGSRVHMGTVERFPNLHTDWRQMDLGRAPQTGRIEVRSGSQLGHVTFHYGGIQQKMLSPELEQVRARKSWPEVWSEDENISTPVKIDVQQHSAVIFLDGPGSEIFSGFLDTVFLPLIRGKPREISTGNQDSAEILLHAARFPDSARKNIDRLEEGHKQSAESPRQAWNRVIEEQGIHPLFIPALKVYAETVAGEETGLKEITLLTQKLKDSEYFNNHRKWICQSVGWVLRLTDRGFVWSIVSITDCSSIIALPAFGDDHSLPVAVFPALAIFLDRAVISVSGATGLLPETQPKGPAALPPGFYESLLKSVDALALSKDVNKLKYLADAVMTWKKHFNAMEHKALIILLKSLFKKLATLSDEQKSQMRRMIGVIPDDMLLPISFSESASVEVAAVFASILECNIDILPVPSDWILAVDRSFARLTADQATSFLEPIIETRNKFEAPTEQFLSAYQRIINDVLTAMCEGPTESHDVFKTFLLFHGQREKVVRWFSASDLKTQRGCGVAFVGKESSLDVFIKSLDVTEQKKLIFLTSMATEVLGTWIGPMPNCDAKGFIKLLKNKPKLSTALAARSACIEAIAAKCSLEKDSDAHFGIRYLLHGEAAAFGSKAGLLVDSGDAWSEMAKAILLARKEAWRLIPAEVVNVKPTDSKLLEVYDCSPDNVSDLLVGFSSIDAVDCGAVVDHEMLYKAILESWPDSRFEQLKKLKAFPRSVTKELVAITSETFIEGVFAKSFEAVFPNRVFVTDKTGQLAARKIVRTTDERDLVDEVLRKPNPWQYWNAIMDVLPKVTNNKPTVGEFNSRSESYEPPFDH